MDCPSLFTLYCLYLLFPILMLIVRDGTLYFCIVFVATIILVFVSWHDVSQGSSLSFFIGSVIRTIYLAVLSFTGSHLIIELKKLSNVNVNDESAETQSIFFARSDPGRQTAVNDTRVEDENREQEQHGQQRREQERSGTENV
ncbi:hypothetical protein BDQ17DRAFT_895210 [Cyathus striatus]|nr:hypothetical protein BDQ17DRAFT_895210 [Cyathus striatus]